MAGAALVMVLLLAGVWYARETRGFVSSDEIDSEQLKPSGNPERASGGTKMGRQDWRTGKAVPAESRQALAYANELRANERNVWATLTMEAVEFRYPDGEQVSVPHAEGEVAIAVAPFRTRTHDCVEHSITGCRGELGSRGFTVTVSDSGGSIVRSETVESESNGFFELWLPADNTYELEVETSLGTARRTVSTFATDPTCITDMRLS